MEDGVLIDCVWILLVFVLMLWARTCCRLVEDGVRFFVVAFDFGVWDWAVAP
jgi:hypothetical protein